jgi:dephospho-CoA kinase
MAAVTYRLGLTGGIGSGKSTVSGMLGYMGAATIDADAISKSVTASGGTAIAAIETAFGSAMLNSEGALDREKMRKLIYSDPNAKARLEAIIHPLVGQAISEQAKRAESISAACIVFDIPLLVESKHWRASLDRILVVDCTEETQISRVMSRNSLADAEVRTILVSQARRPQRLAAADIVLFNDGIAITDLEHLVREIGTQFGL